MDAVSIHVTVGLALPSSSSNHGGFGNVHLQCVCHVARLGEEFSPFRPTRQHDTELTTRVEPWRRRKTRGVANCLTISTTADETRFQYNGAEGHSRGHDYCRRSFCVPRYSTTTNFTRNVGFQNCFT